MASVVAERQSSTVICGSTIKRCYLALHVFFLFSMRVVVVMSKNRVSVLFQSLFTCVGTNLFHAKCMYNLSLKAFTVLNGKQTRVFFTP